jgi:hypothetical protein
MKAGWHSQFKRSPKEKRTFLGITFDSLAEMHRYQNLRIAEKSGLIAALSRQDKHELRLPDGKPILVGKRVAVYTSDFQYKAIDWQVNGVTHRGAWIIEDVKGFYDRESKFRIAVFEALTGHKVSIIKV